MADTPCVTPGGSAEEGGAEESQVTDWGPIWADAEDWDRPGSPGQAVLVVHGGHDAALQVLAGSRGGAESSAGRSETHHRAPGPGTQQQADHHRPGGLQLRERGNWG